MEAIVDRTLNTVIRYRTGRVQHVRLVMMSRFQGITVLNNGIEPGPPFSENDIALISAALCRNLPEDYIKFVKCHGAAFIGGLIDADPALPILAFHDHENIIRLISFHEDLATDKILPFARCELGNFWVIDNLDHVHYINFYNETTTSTLVDQSFVNFISRIVIEQDPK